MRLVAHLGFLLFAGTIGALAARAQELPSAADLVAKYHLEPPTGTHPTLSAVVEMGSRVISVGTAIPFVLRLENRSGKPQQVPLANMYKRVFSYRVFGPSGAVWADPEIGLAPPNAWELPLSAKASLVETAVWDQQKFFGPSDYGAKPDGQVPPGDYVIILTVNLDSTKVQERAQSALSFRIKP